MNNNNTFSFVVKFVAAAYVLMTCYRINKYINKEEE